MNLEHYSDAENQEPADETYGVYLNTSEGLVFELALQGMPVKRIAERLEMPVGLVRAFLRPDQPTRRALSAANSQTHKETEVQRRLLMQMSFDEAQDQLSRPDSEVSPAEKRELIYAIWDRMGLPKVTHSKGEIRHTGGVAVAMIDTATLLGQIAQLATARQVVAKAIVGEGGGGVGPSEPSRGRKPAARSPLAVMLRATGA